MDGQQGCAGGSPAGEAAKPLLDGWLTRAQIAAELGLSIDTLARWEAQRIGPPCVRIGRRAMYRAESFRQWLEDRERDAVAAREAVIRARREAIVRARSSGGAQ
jgi:hypothetical protein